MTFEQRKERSLLHNDLVYVLTKDVKDDAQYFRRLTWALEFLSNNISRFDDLIEEGINVLVMGDEEDEELLDIPDEVDESNYDPYCGCDVYETIDLDEWSDY